MINFAIIIIFSRNSAIAPETKLYHSQLLDNTSIQTKKTEEKYLGLHIECC